MSDDSKKPDPVDDLKKGIGLLFRAAKSAVDQLPTEKLEKVVVTGVKEVGRAIENVTDQIDRQVFHGKGTVPHPEDAKGKDPAKTSSSAPPAPADTAAADPDAKKKDDDAAPADADTKDDPPKGPRVA